MNIRPFGDYILIQKCVKDQIRNKEGEILLYRTDFDTEYTHICEVLECGPKCKYITNEMLKEHKGKVFIVAPERDEGLRNIQNEFYVIREKTVLDNSGVILYG